MISNLIGLGLFVAKAGYIHMTNPKQLVPPKTIYHCTHIVGLFVTLIFPLKPSPWSRSDPIFISGPCLLCMGPDFHIWDPIFISGPWCLLCLGPDGDGCVTVGWEVMGINSLLNLSRPHHHHHCHHHQLLIRRACSWIKEEDKEWESDMQKVYVLAPTNTFCRGKISTNKVYKNAQK